MMYIRILQTTLHDETISFDLNLSPSQKYICTFHVRSPLCVWFWSNADDLIHIPQERRVFGFRFIIIIWEINKLYKISYITQNEVEENDLRQHDHHHHDHDDPHHNYYQSFAKFLALEFSFFAL